MEAFLDSISSFAAYFGAALALTILFVVFYSWTTPHNEMKLIREGNGPAALGLAGAVLGFVMPLSQVISVSGDLQSAMIWGAVALIVQTIGHIGSLMLFPRLSFDIADGKYSAAIVQAGIALCLGILQAACWTP